MKGLFRLISAVLSPVLVMPYGLVKATRNGSEDPSRNNLGAPGSPPLTSIAVSKDGGWDSSEALTLGFGEVLAGAVVGGQIRICNEGGSVLTITRSRPPISPQLTAINPEGELFEGQMIAAGGCAYATVAVYAANGQPNHPSQRIDLVWVLGTDGRDVLNPSRDFGVRQVKTGVTIVSRQVGPKFANGTALYQWTGCLKDTPSRNLATQINGQKEQLENNTNGNCQSTCFTAGYIFAGTEYRQECWCGNTIRNPASYRDEALNLCTFACTGDDSESCGGDGGYLSLYADATKFNIPQFLGSVRGGRLTSTTTRSSPTSAPPTSPSSPAELWGYLGCFSDNVGGARSLPSRTTASNTMTLELCASFCSGYNFFGTEYGRECYCGYSISGSLSTNNSECSTPCAGNAAQVCGRGDRLSVYRNSVHTPPPPKPSHAQRVGDYVWVGCYSEANTGRALSTAARADDAMTTRLCAAFCAGEGTRMMGVEYGRECFCGDGLGGGATIQDAEECDMECKGNAGEFCGGRNRLDLYQLSR